MSSKTAKPAMRSAAWRISLWATLAFAAGTMVVFFVLDQFVATDIHRRGDAWLTGEVEVLADVAERTPNDALYNRVVGEVAELAAHEIPNRVASDDESEKQSSAIPNNSVFFLQVGADRSLKLWVGPGDGRDYLEAVLANRLLVDRPTDIRVLGSRTPFRVASVPMKDGSRVFLGLSERDQLRVVRNLRTRFFLLWLSLVLLGFGIVFFTTRRMLSHVRSISEAASHIGHSELDTRVPTSNRNDEIAQLAITLNGMLDRIESSMHQLHTITDSLAHDLRSPLTAIRGKLESSLSTARDGEPSEAIVSAIDELDRLTDFLNKSLDVAEARADALRLTRVEIDLDELLRAMVDLYEPSMSERDLTLSLASDGPLRITGDAGLLHRMIANLFDNELKHLPAGCSVTVGLHATESEATLMVEDNGPGFDWQTLASLFVRRVKGKQSSGHGLGLAFIDAVVRAHGGTVNASNGGKGGARIVITLPLASTERGWPLTSSAAS
ncbi:HAMP domain-containing histidine kinase [Occallatibacter riparius]|uniref:histidine kinase n=1 Tax=Occallatibacter riparius TaxID=1002689 RepID=A0A9J7BXG4_9BACT|nr:HAMP domain-containing histidine kinase [Occallatibacter riparius]UWZ85678.1 HAMP domain-containing histidine kinase [Occallatibacter riparius]